MRRLVVFAPRSRSVESSSTASTKTALVTHTPFIDASFTHSPLDIAEFAISTLILGRITEGGRHRFVMQGLMFSPRFYRNGRGNGVTRRRYIWTRRGRDPRWRVDEWWCDKVIKIHRIISHRVIVVNRSRIILDITPERRRRSASSKKRWSPRYDDSCKRHCVAGGGTEG